MTDLRKEDLSRLRDSTLTTLDFRGNKIGSDGATQIADALQFNSTLTKLDLECMSNEDILTVFSKLCMRRKVLI